MSKNGFLALLVCVASGIGLAACSGGGGGTQGPSGPMEQSAPTLSEARAAVQDYEARLNRATDADERADLTLRLASARADAARAEASVQLRQARDAVQQAAAQPTAASIGEAERLLAAARASAVSALEAAVAAVKAAGGDAASTADAEALLARVRPAAVGALEEAVAVQARARALLEEVVGYQASADAQIQRLRQQVSGGGSGTGSGAYSEERAAVGSAVEASRQAASANTPEARAAARAAIASARSALDALVSAAEAAVEAAAGGEALGAATRARDAAVAFRAAQALLLDAAEGRIAWSSRLPVAVEIALTPEVAAVRSKRRTVDGARLYSESSFDAPTLLTPSQIPPVMHEAGKIVMAPGRAGSGDRLRMRGMPIVYAVNPCFDPPCTPPNFNSLTYSLVHGIYSAQYVSRTLADIQNNRSALVAGLRITRDGLSVNLGGKNAQGSDFRLENFNYRNSGIYESLLGVYNPSGVTSFRNIRNGYDLALAFGRPSASPQGSAEHRWLAELMPSAEQVTAAGGSGSWLGTGPLGVYDVRLSNHIGRNAKTEFEDGTPFPDDDENFYLSYAAYGFMDFYRPGQAPVGTLGGANLTHRVFPFHVGYDAFADRRGKRTTDIAEAITGGTFKGRTLAQEFALVGVGLSAPVYLSPTDTKRMRGDIELTATISATGASNTIAGKISNMQDWVVSQDGFGSWRDSTSITADIRFHTDGTIDAKGEFTGTFANYPAGFARGGYRGNLYGPHDGLEAAGAWAMGPASGRRRAIAGSFGAALVQDDGSYGTRVVGGGGS